MQTTRVLVRPIFRIDLVFAFAVLLRFITDHSVTRLILDLLPPDISLSLLLLILRSNSVDGFLLVIAVEAIDAWNDIAS